MRNTSLAILTAVILSLAARDALAAPRAERFPARVTVGERTTHLNGVGLCEWGFFAIDLYYCALYLERKTTDPKVVISSRQAKRIHLRFVRSLTRAQLQKAYTVSVEVNAGKELPRYRTRLKQLAAAMENVKAGDSLIFDYVPGRGIEITLKKKRRGLIKGDDFARLFFTLYFGPKPPDEDLKRAMLGACDD